jgi:DNA helicase HerA-like ATPase
MERTDNLIIAIVGASGAGKSHYLAVLLEELSHRGSADDAALTAVDDETRALHEMAFRRDLYRDHTLIPRTTERRPSPLLFRLTFPDGPRFLGALRAATLVFFDAPGENFSSEDDMRRYNRYVGAADGIVMLVDPLATPGFRRNLVPPGTSIASAQEPFDILSRTEQLIRMFHKLGVYERISTPMAVTFTKMDAVRPLLSPGSILRRDSPRSNRPDSDEFARVDAAMRAYTIRWLGAGFDKFLRQRFTHAAYFGVSALGGSADADGLLPHGVSAFRVLDPLFWLLLMLRVMEPAPSTGGGARHQIINGGDMTHA